MDKILETTAGFDTSHLLALINAVGGRDNAIGLCNGSKKAKVEDVSRILIGKNMRFVIPHDFDFGHVDLNPEYYFEQPTEKFDVDAFVKRSALYLPKGMKIPNVAQMEDVWDKLEREIAADKEVSNLFKVKDRRRGIRLRFFIPQMDIVHNINEAIFCLNMGIRAAYEDEYGEFEDEECDSFECYNNTEVGVTIVEEGQRKLVSMLRDGPVCGWIFPAVFQGISIDGDRALMELLPRKYNWSLGGIESLMAAILHTKVLCRDGKTPVHDLASFQIHDTEDSLYLLPDDEKLVFGTRNLGPREYYSAALSVFQQLV